MSNQVIGMSTIIHWAKSVELLSKNNYNNFLCFFMILRELEKENDVGKCLVDYFSRTFIKIIQIFNFSIFHSSI